MDNKQKVRSDGLGRILYASLQFPATPTVFG